MAVYFSFALILAVAFTAGWSNPAIPRAGKTFVINFFRWFGELGVFCARLARVAFVPPFEGRELLRQMDAIGSKSLPLVALAGAATGVVLSLETRDSLTRFGAKSMLPAVIIFSLIKESGPIITGLVVSGRVGAGIGAELGSMKVTEQIDAMKASAVDPYQYLVATRVLTCIAMLPLLTLAADFCGVLMGWISNTLVEPITLRLFLDNGTKGIAFSDFLPPTFKTAIYGLIIGVVSCFEGMRTQGGTEGVGRSTTTAVVLSSLFIILADVVLVRLILIFSREVSMAHENNNPAVEVKDLTKSFGSQKVLNGINLSAARGETLAVLGRSGTGKSILLRLLIGLQTPDSGSIRIEGQEIVGLERKQLNEIRKKIGFLFQQGALYDSLTVEENVMFPLSRHTTLSDEERKARARELLSSVGMEKDLEKMPSQISGGMQKRVGMARALALDPAVVLFDEPTAGLDPITSVEIETLMSQLKKKHEMTSIVVTHDLRGARNFADRLVMLNQGNILVEGTFDELQKSKDQFVAQFLKDAA